MRIPVTIDGIRVEVDRGTMLINAIKKAGIYVPTLCHHERVKPYGACRICTVEVGQNGQKRLITSCSFPTDAAMDVFTDTSAVRHVRRMVMKLLLARCPDSSVIRTLAKRLGVDSAGFTERKENNCILCGLCVRFCEEVVGAGALGLANRGVDREVATPFNRDSDVCIGCGSCSYICPTECIEMVPTEGMPPAHAMKMGGHSLSVCQNSYDCESCTIDTEFHQEMKRVIDAFRNSVTSDTDLS